MNNSKKKSCEWNDKIEEVVKNIGEMSTGYKIMHIEVAQQNYKSYKKWMLLAIVLGPISGVLSSIGAVINSDIILPIIASIFSFLSGIAVSIVKFGNFEELSIANKNAAAKYTSLENNVRRQLSLYRKNRIQSHIYMEWVETKFDELFISSPLIPLEIYNKYIEFAKENGKIIPHKYSTIIKINDSEEIEKTITDISNIKIKSGDDDVLENKNIENNNQQSNPKIISIDISENTPQQSPTKIIKRSPTFSNLIELTTFNDGMMNYELSRMFK
jgi:hypothetical protein